MTQSSLWQIQTDTGKFAELCNALYQREISFIANGNFSNAQAVQVRLTSLPYYISRTAHAMTEVIAQGHTPLLLDYQNASWTAKQSRKIPLTGQETELEREKVNNWYLQNSIHVGLVIPVLLDNRIIIDCIDRIDHANKRIRTNVTGWFSLISNNEGGRGKVNINQSLNSGFQHKEKRLLKPNKKVMISASTGQCWQGDAKIRPVMPTLRELLLSCSINWTDFKKPLAI